MSSNDADIIKRLKTAKNYKEFHSTITNILNKIGFDMWIYRRLDSPLCIQFDNMIGRNCEVVKLVYEQGFEWCDLAYQHVVRSREAIHQSTVNQYVIDSVIKTDLFRGADNLAKYMATLGYSEGYLIPCESSTGRYCFTVSRQYVRQDDFKNMVIDNSSLLMLMARIVDDIGCSKYKKQFLSTGLSYEKLCKSKPVELFKLCYEKDISIKEASKIMGISQKTSEMHSKKFRKMMDAETTLLAIYKAIKFGIIKKEARRLSLIKSTDRGTFKIQFD